MFGKNESFVLRFTASDATGFARGLMQPQLSLNEKKNSEEAGTVLTSSEKLRKVWAVLARGHATGKWRPEGSSLDTICSLTKKQKIYYLCF